jgi:hypothetical protein
MNFKKKYPLIILFLCLFLVAKSQPKLLPDSVRIEFADLKCVVLFEMRDYAVGKVVIKNLPTALSTLLGNVQKSIPQQELATPHKITVVIPADPKPGFSLLPEKELGSQQEITIQKEKETTTLSTKDNVITELLPPGWSLSIQANRYRISIYAPNFEALTALTQQNFDAALSALDADPSTNRSRRVGFGARLVLQNGVVAFNKIEHRELNDILGLHFGAGVGVFRDKVYPELNFTTAFYFSNRYRSSNQRVAFTYELKYFTSRNDEGSYQTLPNSFLSVSYSRNFAKERPRWTGIGVGYLVQSKGDLYTGKTMKFFFESDIGSPKINLVPEFYLTNDFKTFAFGVKLKYEF